MRTTRLLLAVFALALIFPLLLAACGDSDQLAHTSPETDREALVALYNATGGPNWESHDNWLSSAPVGEWHGVSVDAEWRVVELLLGDNQLSGALPPELGDLANLRELGLWSNQLSGEIPPELGNLANLTGLYLGINQLSGEIPPELGNFANLAVLGLYDNQLSGCISDYLSSLSFAVDLPVCTPPDHLGDKEALVAVYNATGGPNWNSNDNWLSSAPVGEWHGVSVDAEGRVVELLLGRNQLSGALPPELGNLASLLALDLGDNQLSGALPPELGDLANLRELGLWSNQLSGEIPPELG